MGNDLSGDQCRTAFRRLGEIMRQLGQPEYPFDPAKALEAFQKAGEGLFDSAEGELYSSRTYAADIIPPGMEIEREFEPTRFEVGNLVLVSFKDTFSHCDGSITGSSVIDRAAKLRGDYSLSHAKYLLNHQAEIPIEWRKYWIVFTRTILRIAKFDPNPAVSYNHYLPCIRWKDDEAQWKLQTRGTSSDFAYEHFRLLCLRRLIPC